MAECPKVRGFGRKAAVTWSACRNNVSVLNDPRLAANGGKLAGIRTELGALAASYGSAESGPESQKKDR